MSLNAALQIAGEITNLRKALNDAQAELAEVNVRRTALQTLVTSLQADLVQKRQDFRAEAVDA